MAATNEEIISFINLMGPLAIAECNRRIANGSKFVVPSVAMAMSAHETGWGLSQQMQKYNAFFGIKPGSSWTGRTFSADTWEVYDGVPTNITSLFRAYDSLEDSVADFYDLIINNSRYSRALSTYPDDVKSAYDTLYEIWAGGYATDEEYVPHVYNLLTGRDLEQYDSQIDGKTFDPDYEWSGGGSSGGGTTETGTVLTYGFEKIENIKL